MNIKKIEPTPSPNTMKIILDHELPMSARNNYTSENAEGAPKEVQQLLQIPGVKGVYHVADFLAVERNAKYDWKTILQEARAIFGETVETNGEVEIAPHQAYGEVKVFYQMYVDIPIQIKLVEGDEEHRVGLPERFKATAMKLQMSTSNVIFERKWVEKGIRYGTIEEISNELAEEVDAAYPVERLDEIIASLTDGTVTKEEKQAVEKVTIDMLEKSDWKTRYALLDRMNPTIDDVPVLVKALRDEKAAIRRLATVYLGMIESDGIIAYLVEALQDKTVTVRRTAGDCLSDIGNVMAMSAMIEALKDKSKLVRWRAAMFLFEVGDESALPALKAAEDDPEFEVSMQIKLAIERIEQGEEAKGSIWKQMIEVRQEEK
jgi:Virulence factor/Scaffold protein Nfu/NifU N terminal/HEAT repeats